MWTLLWYYIQFPRQVVRESDIKVLRIASKFLELSDPLILIFVSSFGL